MVEEFVSLLHSIPALSGELGAAGLLVFCGLAIATQLILLPISPFSIFAGFACGFWKGFALIMAAKMASALVNFSLTRWSSAKWVEKVSRRHPILGSMNDALEQDGLKLAILLRMCPIPFAVANYSYGLTKMSLPSFLTATFIAVLMPSLTLVAVGTSMRDALSSQSTSSASTRWESILTASSVVASLLVATRLSKAATTRLAARVDPSQNP